MAWSGAQAMLHISDLCLGLHVLVDTSEFLGSYLGRHWWADAANALPYASCGVERYFHSERMLF